MLTSYVNGNVHCPTAPSLLLVTSVPLAWETHTVVVGNVTRWVMDYAGGKSVGAEDTIVNSVREGEE